MSKSPTRSAPRNIEVIESRQRTTVNEDGTVTVHIPISFKRHGGRKYIIAPDAVPEEYAVPVAKDSLLKGLARAFEWQALMESNDAITQNEIADKEKLPRSYVSRIMKLTLLAPDIIDAILNGKQPKQMTLIEVGKMPNDWNEQRAYFGFV